MNNRGDKAFAQKYVTIERKGAINRDDESVATTFLKPHQHL
jgi:hypothetical protein